MLLLKDLTQTHSTECTYWTEVYSIDAMLLWLNNDGSMSNTCTFNGRGGFYTLIAKVWYESNLPVTGVSILCQPELHI